MEVMQDEKRRALGFKVRVLNMSFCYLQESPISYKNRWFRALGVGNG